MAAINPISGMRPPISPIPTAAAAKTSPADKGNIGDLVKGYLNNVDQDQKASVASLQDLLSGKSMDIFPVVSAAAKADMSFKLLIGVRNKLIEAYKQTMNMQI